MEELKRKGVLFVFALMGTFERALTVTNLTDNNFNGAISTCSSTNPVDVLCSSSEYGAMPDWDSIQLTSMAYGFSDNTFNADFGSWNTSQVTNMRYMFDSAPSFNQDISLDR